MVNRAQELEATSHIISLFRKQREINADAKPASVSMLILNSISLVVKTDYHTLEFLFPAPSVHT